MADPEEDEIARQRDDVIKRMIATPPTPHKKEAKRRLVPDPAVRQLPKRRTNKRREQK